MTRRTHSEARRTPKPSDDFLTVPAFGLGPPRSRSTADQDGATAIHTPSAPGPGGRCRPRAEPSAWIRRDVWADTAIRCRGTARCSWNVGRPQRRGRRAPFDLGDQVFRGLEARADLARAARRFDRPDPVRGAPADQGQSPRTRVSARTANSLRRRASLGRLAQALRQRPVLLRGGRRRVDESLAHLGGFVGDLLLKLVSERTGGLVVHPEHGPKADRTGG